MNKVKFPGFNLEFTLNETAFTVFGLDIKWYGIIITTGILLSFLLFYRLAVKREQLDPDSIYNITLLVMPIAIIGARFVYVVTEWEDRFKGKGFLNMINIRQGGIAIYGAIIFGLITVLIYNKIKKQSSLSMLDALAPAVMLGQTIGRWGNFVNAEAYGWSEGVENLPWRMWLEKVYIDDIYQPDIHFVHPTFLYESLWNLVGFILLNVLYRKRKFDGQIFMMYFAWYGFGRMFIEGLRTDSLYVGPFRISQVIGCLTFLAATTLIIIFWKKGKRYDSASYKEIAAEKD